MQSYPSTDSYKLQWSTISLVLNHVFYEDTMQFTIGLKKQ